jgi:hypothetical protein
MAVRATAKAGERAPSAIDRRTVGPALLVLALAVLMSVVLPWIDSRAEYQHAVGEGDVAQLADGITLVPAHGWDLASGALVGDTRSSVGTTTTTQLVRGGVTFTVHTAPFEGAPSELLTRVHDINAELAEARGSTAATTRRYLVTTRQGVDGVAENFVGPTMQGAVVAFVFDVPPAAGDAQGQSISEGVEIVVSGPKGEIARHRDDVVAMIESVRVTS